MVGDKMKDYDKNAYTADGRLKFTEGSTIIEIIEQFKNYIDAYELDMVVENGYIYLVKPVSRPARVAARRT